MPDQEQEAPESGHDVTARTHEGADGHTRKVVPTIGHAFFATYANYFALQTSSSEFKLQLGVINEATESEMKVTILGEVYITPLHMKSLVELLGRGMAGHEKLAAELLQQLKQLNPST